MSSTNITNGVPGISIPHYGHEKGLDILLLVVRPPVEAGPGENLIV